MTADPLVSVVIPTFNRRHILPRAIGSVERQTYTNWELIIVDDESTDLTEQYVTEMRHPEVTYLLNNRVNGPGGARNTGIHHAHGTYLAFLDSDDEWLPEHLADSISLLERTDVDICGALCITDDGHKRLEHTLPHDTIPFATIANGVLYLGDRLLEAWLAHGCYCMSMCTTVLHRDLVSLAGDFDESLLATQDEEFITRQSLHGSYACIMTPHFIYYAGEDNIAFRLTPTAAQIYKHRSNMIRQRKQIARYVDAFPQIQDKKSCRSTIEAEIIECHANIAAALAETSTLISNTHRVLARLGQLLHDPLPIHTRLLLRLKQLIFQYSVTYQDDRILFDTIFKTMCGGSRAVFLIQIGANDGITEDPIHRLLTKFPRIDWNGILIEPQKEDFNKLIKNYENFTGFTMANIAITKRSGPIKLYTPKTQFRNETWSTLLGSLVPERGLMREHMKNNTFEVEVVEGVTFDDILEKHNVLSVDLLQIDTEGYDYEIIKTIDFGRVKPKIINFERKNLRADERKKVYELLWSRGYTIREYGRLAPK